MDMTDSHGIKITDDLLQIIGDPQLKVVQFWVKGKPNTRSYTYEHLLITESHYKKTLMELSRKVKKTWLET